MASIFTPSNQIKLTNVSVVRYKKGGGRFEIACYKNKVQEWRNKVTRELDEVVQIHSIFINVSKGQVAKKEELLKAFNTTDEKAILLEILNKGELQIGAKEREWAVNNLKKDIATIIADKCIHPVTKRPYTVSMIEKAMTDLHVSIKPEVSAKQQALDIIKRLEKSDVIQLERAQMQIKVQCSVHFLTELRNGLSSLASIKKEIVDADVEDAAETEVRLECTCEPGKYKAVTDLVQKLTKGQGSVYTLNMKGT